MDDRHLGDGGAGLLRGDGSKFIHTFFFVFWRQVQRTVEKIPLFLRTRLGKDCWHGQKTPDGLREARSHGSFLILRRNRRVLKGVPTACLSRACPADSQTADETLNFSAESRHMVGGVPTLRKPCVPRCNPASSTQLLWRNAVNVIFREDRVPAANPGP